MLDNVANVTSVTEVYNGPKTGRYSKYHVYGFSNEMKPVTDRYIWEGIGCIIDSSNLMSLKDVTLIGEMVEKDHSSKLRWMTTVDLKRT